MATKRKVKKYADGSDMGDFAGVDEAVARNSDSGEWARGENYGDGTTGDERVAMARAPRREATQEDMDSLVAAPRFEPEAETKKTFKQAFAAARGAGDKTFEWNGKKYTTELASEKKAAPAPAAAPAAKPAAPAEVTHCCCHHC